MTDQVKTRITIEDLERPENEYMEVVDGDWVETDTDMMGILHTLVIDNLYDILKPFVKANRLGTVHTDGVKYVLHVDEHGVQTAYRPDLAFYRKGRIAQDYDLHNLPFPGAPDLAVEVMSPGQGMPYVLRKTADYLRYGTQEVWVIYPVKRELHRYRRDEQAPEIYTDSQSLQPESLFPGLTVKVAELFVAEEA